MVIFELNAGGMVKVDVYDFTDVGDLTFSGVKEEIKDGLLEETVIGGVLAIGEIEGSYIAIPEDVEFALVGMGLGYNLTGVFYKPDVSIDGDLVY